MQCPKCTGILDEKNVEGVKVDQCDQCSGIWFDLGELDEVLDQEFHDELENQVRNNTGHDDKRAPCPRCLGDTQMVQLVADKGIKLDKCTFCSGVWLDGGEYEILAEHGFIAGLKKLFRFS